MANNDDRHTEVPEEGDTFFLYRLEVEEEPSGLGDVQRFYVVLCARRQGSCGCW